jgi:hypothetical protein
MAAALTGIMPLPYDPGARTQVGVGMGAYKGESAFAVGINHYFSESTLFNLGMSFDGGDTMYRGGVTWRFGKSTKRMATADVAKLQAQLSEQDAKLKQQDAKIQQQAADLEMLKQQVAAMVSPAQKVDDASKYKR